MGWCFKRNGRNDRIRTYDPLVPNQVLYQAELHSVRYINGALDRTRTYNLLIRSQMLYPIELRTHYENLIKMVPRGRNRTGTMITHRRILSPVRLPVPPPRHMLERKTRFELATPTLARWCSTTELLPHVLKNFYSDKLLSLNKWCG